MYELKQIYNITCVLTTIGLVSWVSYEYSLDEDATQIHINQFHKTTDDIYSYILSSRLVEEMGGITGIFQNFVQNFLFPFSEKGT